MDSVQAIRWARTRNCSRSPNLAPNSNASRSTRGSEAKPTTSSWYSSFRGRERSLNLGRLWWALWHSRIKSASSLSLRRSSALGSVLWPQTFALIKGDLGPYYLLVTRRHLIHRFYVQTAGHKDNDIISVHGYICRKRTSKKKAARNRTCFLIAKQPEQGLQSEDTEKRRPGATLQDWSLDH